MRRLVTGVDDQGRSCLVETTEVEPVDVGNDHGVNVARVHLTSENPPPPRPPGNGALVPVSLDPGIVRWMVVEHEPFDESDGPKTSSTLHHTDALNLVFVHDGSADLLLEDGAHPVEAGDHIVMPGIDHAMKGGPDGCRLVVVSIGTSPPA